MDIPAWLFISFWALISITSLHLGFQSLDQTELSHSVSPAVMFLFKHSLAISSCFSSTYALTIRSQSRYAVRSSSVFLVYVFFAYAIIPQTRIIKEMLYILVIGPFAWVPYIPYFNIWCQCLSVLSLIEMIFVFFILNYNLILFFKNNFSEHKTRSGILLLLEIFLLFSGSEKAKFSPILVVTISYFISILWVLVPRLGDGSIVARIRRAVRIVQGCKAKKLIEFGVGTVGAILFQNFFRISSFGEVGAFLFLAVTWLANLVLMGFGGDFGVFNFLLANVVVGCTVGQFGLRGATWVALGAALVLFALRLKLESVHMVYEEGQTIRVLFSDDESMAQLPP